MSVPLSQDTAQRVHFCPAPCLLHFAALLPRSTERDSITENKQEEKEEEEEEEEEKEKEEVEEEDYVELLLLT